MRDYPVDEEELAERTALVRQSQDAFGALLSKSCLEITYEELCGNHDVDTIEQTAADRIMEFLGVSGGKKMITPLRKTSSSSVAPIRSPTIVSRMMWKSGRRSSGARTIA
jgi:hypothetical protein